MPFGCISGFPAAHEEALEIRRHAAARDDHGQAFARRCEGEDGLFRRTSPAQSSQQSGWEFSSADAATRRIMKRFKSSRQAQRFLSLHVPGIVSGSVIPGKLTKPQTLSSAEVYPRLRLARSSRPNASPASALASKVCTIVWPVVPIRPQSRISETPPNKVGWIESK
jgi:hypothetical protein